MWSSLTHNITVKHCYSQLIFAFTYVIYLSPDILHKLPVLCDQVQVPLILGNLWLRSMPYFRSRKDSLCLCICRAKGRDGTANEPYKSFSRMLRSIWSKCMSMPKMVMVTESEEMKWTKRLWRYYWIEQVNLSFWLMIEVIAWGIYPDL